MPNLKLCSRTKSMQWIMDSVQFANEAAINTGFHCSASKWLALHLSRFANHGAISGFIILAKKWLTTKMYSATQRLKLYKHLSVSLMCLLQIADNTIVLHLY